MDISKSLDSVVHILRPCLRLIFKKTPQYLKPLYMKIP